MRIGIFSDVHANLEALGAVIEAFQSERIDEYYCLGDVVGYGASPDECVTIVRQVAKQTILGNHDAAVAGRMDYSYYYEAARNVLDTHSRWISPDNMEWLKALPYELLLPESDLLLTHGSPLCAEEFEYIFAPEQAQECLPVWERLAPVNLIGHSHLCKVFALKPGYVAELPPQSFTIEPGFKYIISVGSVGQPRDYDNRASYVVWDSATREFEFKRVDYDIETAANKIYAKELEQNFGHRLFIGV